ncbi:hypothetical protein TGRH88_084330 [Toxoplasma gondii]|uniref:Uncharacterized protein n=1 Tax=Toxoplasma gondii TaxID=5811 RepID=A0A7J6KI46_TOXGO|nr:hypothetical protein TGRH88_084330 [Toxoplasma gondii]
MWEGPPETPGCGPCIPDCLGMPRDIPNPSGIPTEDENAVAAVRRILRSRCVDGGATAAPSSLVIAQSEECRSGRAGAAHCVPVSADCLGMPRDIPNPSGIPTEDENAVAAVRRILRSRCVDGGATAAPSSLVIAQSEECRSDRVGAVRGFSASGDCLGMQRDIPNPSGIPTEDENAVAAVRRILRSRCVDGGATAAPSSLVIAQSEECRSGRAGAAHCVPVSADFLGMQRDIPNPSGIPTEDENAVAAVRRILRSRCVDGGATAAPSSLVIAQSEECRSGRAGAAHCVPVSADFLGMQRDIPNPSGIPTEDENAVAAVRRILRSRCVDGGATAAPSSLVIAQSEECRSGRAGAAHCVPVSADFLGMQRDIPNPSGIPTEDENAVAAVRRMWRIWYVGSGATAAPSSLLIAQPEECRSGRASAVHGSPVPADCLGMPRSIPNPSGIPTEDENAVAAVRRILRSRCVDGGATAAPSSLVIAQSEECRSGRAGAAHCVPVSADCLGMQRDIPNPSGIPTEDENAVAAVRRILRSRCVDGGATAAPSSLLIAQSEEAAPVLPIVFRSQLPPPVSSLAITAEPAPRFVRATMLTQLGTTFASHARLGTIRVGGIAKVSPRAAELVTPSSWRFYSAGPANDGMVAGMQ